MMSSLLFNYPNSQETKYNSPFLIWQYYAVYYLCLRETLNIFIKYKTMVMPNIEIIFISQRFGYV